MCSSLHHTVSHKVTVKTESSNELNVTKPCQSFAPLVDYVYLNAIPWQLLTGYKTSWACLNIGQVSLCWTDKNTPHCRPTVSNHKCVTEDVGNVWGFLLWCEYGYKVTCLTYLLTRDFSMDSFSFLWMQFKKYHSIFSRPSRSWT